MHPADASGRFTTARNVTFAVLLAVYAAVPWMEVGGRPAVLLDIARRRFYLFGAVFNARDVWMAFFLLSGIGFALVALTTVAGRVLGVPARAARRRCTSKGSSALQRLMRGPRERRVRREAGDWTFGIWRRALLWALYGVVSAAVAHVFLGCSPSGACGR